MSIKAYEKKPLGMSDIIRFGKYKDEKTIEWIIENDANYLNWMVDETGLLLTDEAYATLSEYLRDDEESFQDQNWPRD